MRRESISIKSKLFRLKKWFLLPDAAKYLSMLFNEEVSESDVLRLALDKYLTLSVNFVNHTRVRRGKIVPYEEVEYCPLRSPSLLSDMANYSGLPKVLINKPSMKSLYIDENRFINLQDKVTVIEGVWDLPLIGAEQLDIEHEFQILTGGQRYNPYLSRRSFCSEKWDNMPASRKL